MGQGENHRGRFNTFLLGAEDLREPQIGAGFKDVGQVRRPLPSFPPTLWMDFG